MWIVTRFVRVLVAATLLGGTLATASVIVDRAAGRRRRLVDLHRAAHGGTWANSTVGSASSYLVQCYETGASPAAYPQSIAIASGSLPADASFPTTTAQGCTQQQVGADYYLNCNITETPTTADEGTYALTFLATGSGGSPTKTSGTLTLKVVPTLPAWNPAYFSVLKNIPFCYNVSVTGAGSMLPLTSMTAGTTPTGMATTGPNAYGLQNVNLANGTAQVCGEETTKSAGTVLTAGISPVATNGAGSASLGASTEVYGGCTWTASGATTKVEDANQDLDVTGSQSTFGGAVTGGATTGSTSMYTTCTDAYVPSAGAFTTNMADPLPAPTDSNPAASQGDLASSNLELSNGCYGLVEATGVSNYFGPSTALTIPNPWVNGGTCSYGTLGSNSAGGNTDAFATCPPTQYDVDIGYVDCSETASSGASTSESFNFGTDDILFNGQPVPQQSTATLSSSGAQVGDTVNVTGGSNWWGSRRAPPTPAPTGTTRPAPCTRCLHPPCTLERPGPSAVAVTSSTVTIGANTYTSPGAESSTTGPNPCTMCPQGSGCSAAHPASRRGPSRFPPGCRRGPTTCTSTSRTSRR